MKILKRDPLFEKIEKALLKAYLDIPAELEAERKIKNQEIVSKPKPKSNKF